MFRLPSYAWLGLVTMVVSEAAMLLRIEPFWSWHTPIAWTGYILFVDGLVYRLRGHSWLTKAPKEFVFLAASSIPLWLIFEFFNLYIRNWHYINLPPHPVVRALGYGWSFATIWPAIFETGELLAAALRPPGGEDSLSGPAGPSLGGLRRRFVTGRMTPLGVVSVAAGAAMLLWPILWPSPYLAAPVWLGFIFLLDPINAASGGESIGAELDRGQYTRSLNLCLAGFICGVLWEFWNYWARTKWIYAVPILSDFKIFEMPVPGYLGFPAFALECFTLYVSMRLLLWHGPRRAISL